MPTQKGASLYHAMRMCISSRVGMYRSNHVAYTHVHPTSDRVERNKRPSPFPPSVQCCCFWGGPCVVISTGRSRAVSGFSFLNIEGGGFRGDESSAMCSGMFSRIWRILRWAFISHGPEQKKAKPRNVVSGLSISIFSAVAPRLAIRRAGFLIIAPLSMAPVIHICMHDERISGQPLLA